MIANAWAASLDNPTSKHQIARELAAKGHRVLWIEGSGMRTPNVRSGADRGRMIRKLLAAHLPPRKVDENGQGGVWVLSPLFLPVPVLGLVRWFNGLLCLVLASFWTGLLGMKQPALILYPPVFDCALRLWPFRTIYHCVDRWDSFAIYDSTLMRRLDRNCCAAATVVIASARELFDRCKSINANTRLVQHGVNWEHFHTAVELRNGARPADLPGGKLVGFFGLLSEWVDQDLLLTLARSMGDAILVLIGRADVDITKLQAVANIRILGPKHFSELPRYAAFFDVGLIPFHVNALTRSVNPIKLREMLAAGCPVVSSDLPEVAICREGREDLVAIAADHPGFIAAVRGFLARSDDKAWRVKISESARTETWSAKVDEIVTIVKESA